MSSNHITTTDPSHAYVLRLDPGGLQHKKCDSDVNVAIDYNCILSEDGELVSSFNDVKSTDAKLNKKIAEALTASQGSTLNKHTKNSWNQAKRYLTTGNLTDLSVLPAILHADEGGLTLKLLKIIGGLRKDDRDQSVPRSHFLSSTKAPAVTPFGFDIRPVLEIRHTRGTSKDTDDIQLIMSYKDVQIGKNSPVDLDFQCVDELLEKYRELGDEETIGQSVSVSKNILQADLWDKGDLAGVVALLADEGKRLQNFLESRHIQSTTTAPEGSQARIAYDKEIYDRGLESAKALDASEAGNLSSWHSGVANKLFTQMSHEERFLKTNTVPGLTSASDKTALQKLTQSSELTMSGASDD